MRERALALGADAELHRFYLAALQVLNRRKANALTIDCLGGFRRGDLPAYPCVAFSKLNDAGLYGVCENDLDSTMTQLLVTSFSGKPGFVSDPTFDTSRNEVIHAHCVSATKLRGLGAEPSPLPKACCHLFLFPVTEATAWAMLKF